MNQSCDSKFKKLKYGILQEYAARKPPLKGKYVIPLCESLFVYGSEIISSTFFLDSSECFANKIQ